MIRENVSLLQTVDRQRQCDRYRRKIGVNTVVQFPCPTHTSWAAPEWALRSNLFNSCFIKAVLHKSMLNRSAIDDSQSHCACHAVHITQQLWSVRQCPHLRLAARRADCPVGGRPAGQRLDQLGRLNDATPILWSTCKIWLRCVIPSWRTSGSAGTTTLELCGYGWSL